MKTKKTAASIIAIMMFVAIFVTTAAAFTAPIAENNCVEFEYSEGNCDGLYVNLRDNCTDPDGPGMPTLRIYGEGDISAAFPYTNAEDPFDMDMTKSDFVVFNPAYIGAHDLSDGIKRHVDGQGSSADANQKTFIRQWYVPEYKEPTGMVWTQQPPVVSPDIVTEYTYMLLRYSDNLPTFGHAGITRLYLPIGSIDAQIGLESFVPVRGTDKEEIVEIIGIGDFNSDGLKDIDVATYNEITVDQGQTVEFLDHAMEVNEVFDDERVQVSIYYLGNDDQWHQRTLTVNVGDAIVAGRGDVKVNAASNFYYPWHIEITGIMTDTHKAIVKVGRLIHMGETFFVDGAEYDIAMIYGPEASPDQFTTFKYITIRNPLPKCTTDVCVDVELGELSIYKERVSNCTVLPMLPPFNMDHTMIDDINLHDCYTGCPDDTACDIPGYDGTDLTQRMLSEGPLEVMWYAEDIETRFHTNLLEILKEQNPELWQWVHIHILPDHYTEMVYPPLQDATVCTPPNKLLGDFLLVSSWEAPNSCNDRMKFAYDAEDSSDIYVNEQDDCGSNSVRIYGEGNMSAAFPYKDPEGPFNKLSDDAPRKDFVTFNPAYIAAHDLSDGIKRHVDGQGSSADANEKTFVRQWYVPEYEEPTGMVWTQQPPVKSPDIVTEYTYMLLTYSDNLPTFGHAGITRLYLPIGSIDSQIGLESFVPVRGTGRDEIVEIVGIGDFNIDGLKDIDVATYNEITMDQDQTVEFLDHAMKVNEVFDDGRMQVSIFYLGNDDQWHLKTLTAEVGDVIVAGRGDVKVNEATNFYYPWHIEITGIITDTHKAIVKVGRLIHMGETFFVDGAEYDIAMIYGPEANPDQFTTFKYITIRNPLPKCNADVCEDVELGELSIYKERVSRCDELPMLPPFNMDHKIVDDIGIPHTCPMAGDDLIYGDYIQDEPGTNGHIAFCADTVAERIVVDQPAFVSYFVEETVEERFRTNLLEILDEGTGTAESWEMLCMWTLPWSYTAMVYPDVGDMTNCNTKDYTIKDADFIVTTSGSKKVPPPPPVCKGDFDGDGDIDLIDFSSFAASYNSVSTDVNYDTAGDFDGDGDIDLIDFSSFAAVYNTNCP